jgi:hypothetical protein
MRESPAKISRHIFYTSSLKEFMANKNQGKRKQASTEQQKNESTSNVKFDRLAAEAEKERTRKPGSQANSSNRNNSGRGGGKG